jgi:endoglucanase
MEVFDATIKALAKAGVMVILNNHNSSAMWCCSLTDGDGLWWTDSYPYGMWLKALEALTVRYKDEPMVVGNDLRNEIRNNLWQPLLIPSWGDNNVLTDWKLAANIAGNAILSKDPTQLIIVEGLNFATDLNQIYYDPLKLVIPNKVVYSFHYYDWEDYVASYSGSYADFRNDMDWKVAFMLEEGQEYTAPVWMGEFGTASQSNNYWSYLIRYLEERPKIGWAYWAYNGYKTDNTEDEDFGILNKDMRTVRHDWKLADLKTVQFGKTIE